MNTTDVIQAIKNIGINRFIGVPDSVLKPLCDDWNRNESDDTHIVTVNEGAAVALAAGYYLGSEEISCVYMQNSGMGNALNPIASLIHQRVYDIPMLFLIGYRGEPGIKDEPQHVFQGEITLPLLDLLEIEYALLDEHTSAKQWQDMVKRASISLQAHRQFAIVIRKGALSSDESYHFENGFDLKREQVIESILKQTQENDVIITTTGKISREAYEVSERLYGNHDRLFLTVGSMGHASMIALGVAQSNPQRKVYCIDGDGAALMHMGSMNTIAYHAGTNFVHIILNNQAHESVGGMPTLCGARDFAQSAKVFGYNHTYSVKDHDALGDVLHQIQAQDGPILVEVKVALGSRADLGRPKESACANKESFMHYMKGDK